MLTEMPGRQQEDRWRLTAAVATAVSCCFSVALTVGLNLKPPERCLPLLNIWS